MAIAGRVAIVPKGDWSADATYKRLDAVTYNNTLYFAKKEVPAGTATSNTEYWSKSIVGGASAIATTEDAGVVKPDGKSMSVDESGTLSINLDGTTITLDEAKNVIKLADTLKDKINGAFPAANLINNLTTTEAGFGLDARQGKALDDKITEINGSLNNIGFKDVSDKLDTDHVTGQMSAVNIGKIVMVYFNIIPKAVSDNITILPAGTIPNAYVYAYHSINTWGQSAIPDSLMAVRDDGSLAFWSGKDSIGTTIFDSFIYLSR
mgnify:CR=1 FL=1|jgi:hypothetical protein